MGCVPLLSLRFDLLSLALTDWAGLISGEGAARTISPHNALVLMSSKLFCFAALNASLMASFTLAAPFVPTRNAHCVAYSPDGKQVATGTSGMSNDEFPPQPHPSPRKCGVVQVFEMETGKRLQRIESFGDLTRVKFSPDGRFVAYARMFASADGVSLNAVEVFRIADGYRIRKFDRCHAFDFSLDAKTIAVLSRTKCILFDIATGDKVREVTPIKHAIDVRFSPNGKSLAAIVQRDERFRIVTCTSATGETMAETVEFDAPFYSIGFSSGGQWLVSGHTEGTVVIWDTEELKPIASLKTGNKGIARPFFAPGGELLAAGSQDNGDVVFWDLASRKEVRRYTFQRGTFITYTRRGADQSVRPELDPDRFTFSPDGQAFLAGCYGGMIRMVSDGRDVKTFGD